MRTILTRDRESMGRWVAQHAAADLREAIRQYGTANFVVATGSSQIEVLRELVQQADIDWSVVHGFQLDEYIGLSDDHEASLCRYLKERLVDHVPLAAFHYLRGNEDAAETITRTAILIQKTRMDLALVGMGENGHLAFNDPPADFETEEPYLLVELDEPCRMQQVSEGWFRSLDEVPTHAISMTIRQILKAVKIYCSVPDQRKADAVRHTLQGPITPEVPASILRTHADATLIIDEGAASELNPQFHIALERV